MTVGIGSSRVEHTREAYTILNLVGDLGGVLEVFLVLLGIFIYPMSEFSFYLKAMERLFLAKIKSPDFFINVNPEKKKRNKNMKHTMPDKLKGTEFEVSKELHYPIKLRFFKILKMFCLSKINCCGSPSKRSEGSYLTDLYSKGSERVDVSLSLEKLIKTIRNMKIFLKRQKIAEDDFVIQYSHKNVINLDDDDLETEVKNLR